MKQPASDALTVPQLLATPSTCMTNMEEHAPSVKVLMQVVRLLLHILLKQVFMTSTQGCDFFGIPQMKLLMKL
jgi:hypothetical protein